MSHTDIGPNVKFMILKLRVYTQIYSHTLSISVMTHVCAVPVIFTVTETYCLGLGLGLAYEAMSL